MKILCIKDHVCSSINDFREEDEEEEEEEEEDEQSAFLQFSENHRSCVFYGV